MTLLFLCFICSPSLQVNAAAIVDFKPGRIIEDSVFTNSTSMSAQQIQTFLNSKVTSCDTNGLQRSEMNNSGVPDYNGNGTIQRWEWGKAKYNQTTFPCLKDYSEGGRVAAQIIYDVSQTYTINPQVLIVLLQKEQTLVTDTWPSVIQYRSATGYGCPDTAACDAQYYGLTNQLTWAARMFRSILNNSPNWYTPYNLGNNFIRWNPVSSCGGSTVYIENRSTQALYNYTPYQPNASALAAGYGMGDSCGAYGNRNFYLYFRDWFGYNSGPAAFKTANSQTIYVPVEGYRMAVPQMATLQDYGISPESIQTVSQSYVDSRPLPPSNTLYSSHISHIVKSPDDSDEDGGSLYLISLGKRYQFTSMEQFFNYGFSESEISYLPLGYIFSIRNGGNASNFISSPFGSVFKIDSNKKRLFFEYQTYISQNPTDTITPLSYYIVDRIPSGSPIVDRPVLVKYTTGESLLLYSGNNYYSIPDYNTFKCWGFETTLKTPVYRLSSNTYIAQPGQVSPVSCLNSYNNNSSALVSGKIYKLTGASALSNIPAIPVDIAPLYNAHQTVRNLSPYLKTEDNAAVWKIEAGKRRVIPTYNTYLSIGLSSINIDIVPPTVLSAYTDDGIYLNSGQLVKANDRATVYVVSNDKKFAYTSSDLFLSYNSSWSGIDTISQNDLDTNYPSSGNISPFLVDTATGNTYLLGIGGCYIMSDSLLNNFNTSYSSLSTSQAYSFNAFPKTLTDKCSQGTGYIRTSGSSLVYKIIEGTKRPIYSYSSLLASNNNKEPSVAVIDSIYISSIPSGPPL